MNNKYFWLMLISGLFLFTGTTSMGASLNADVRQKVIHTLVNQFKINEKDIIIEKFIEKEWPDSSLGCPKNNQYYLPVITPGYLVEARVNDHIYHLHTSMTRAIICKKHNIFSSEKNTSVPIKPQSTMVKAIQLSRKLLLQDPQIKSKSIHLISVEKSYWSQYRSLCGIEDSVFKSNEPGYFVKLSHNKGKSSFFSNGQTSLNCSKK